MTDKLVAGEMAVEVEIPDTTPDDMSPQMVQAYKDAVDNLIYLKKEQLLIIYYTILGLAALYILANRGSSTANLRAFFEYCTIATTAFSIGMVWHFQRSIGKFRTRLEYLYKRFFKSVERIGMRLEAKKDEWAVMQPTPWLLSIICFVAGCINLALLQS